MKRFSASMMALFTLFCSFQAFGHTDPTKSKFISVNAVTREERTRLLEVGVHIEEVYSDRVWSLANDEDIAAIEKAGFKILSVTSSEPFFRTRFEGFGKGPQFPAKDARYHDYSELKIALQLLQSKYPRISRLETIGKTWEGREIIAIHLNSSIAELEAGQSSKPGIVFMGAHHAREHLSSEIPRMLAEHLLNNQGDSNINTLLNTRDIWIIPMVNPDGAEYDIEGGSYHMWRKNRRANAKESAWGVDLNRNYGFQWGTGGSSTSASSDTYMGPEPFSEPETQAIRDFVSGHTNLKILLSFHTFSELILYPWGHSYDPIPNQRDRQVYETMAGSMARWNGYTPQQSSDLYIASGDTTDWAYGTYGIFSFTFELTPKGMFGGGFYPGAGVIDSTFRANLNPALYLIDLADNPYRAVDQGPGASIWYK